MQNWLKTINHFFKITGRMFIFDDDNENNGGVITLLIEPHFIK